MEIKSGRGQIENNGITVRSISQPTFATKSALFGHAAIDVSNRLSEAKRKFDFELPREASGAKQSMRFAYRHLDIGGNDNVSDIMIREDVARQGVAIV